MNQSRPTLTQAAREASKKVMALLEKRRTDPKLIRTEEYKQKLAAAAWGFRDELKLNEVRLENKM